MLRFIAAICLVCCFTGSIEAQQPLEQKAAEPTAPVPSENASTPVQSDYPLDALTGFSAVMTGSFLYDDDREVHVYRSKNLFRMEGDQGVGYYLTDLSKQVTYHVWDNGCATDNHVYFRAVPWAAAARPGYKVERGTVGTEAIDGHSCKIEDVTLTSPELPKPLKLKLWEAEDLQGFPIKVESVRTNGPNRIIRYKNVVVGPQDPTLFMHPKKCDEAVEEPKPKKPASSSKAKAPAKDTSPH